MKRYAYDANANLTSRTTRVGLAITATYDALNRPATRAVPANPNAAAVNYTYGYDLTGRPLSVRQSIDAAALTYGYDTAGRLTTETDAAGRALTYAYDADGNRLSVTWPALGGPALVAGFEYDAIGRMTRVLEAGQEITAYGYDFLSRRTSLLYPNLTRANWAWRLNDTLEGVVHGFAAGAGVSFGYRRNRENAVSARTVSDAAYLPGVTNPALALGTRAYAANAMNQYTAVAGTTYSYDLDGNLAGDGVWTYGHDPEGRLVAATRPGTTLAYGYDALGRRRSRSVNGTRTDFLLSGAQEMAEYNASGALLRRFVWGPAGPDDIIALIGVTGSVAARRRFHHLDGLGSTVSLTDSTGGVVERYPATAYGVGDVNTGITPWRFTGRRLDPDTGFYHLRARDYAPMIGRFVQPDPIGMAGGINLYAYVENDPLNRTDPSGLIWWHVAGGALGASADLAAQLFIQDRSFWGPNGVDWTSVAGSAVGGALGVGFGRVVAQTTSSTQLRIGLGYAGGVTIATGQEILKLGVSGVTSSRTEGTPGELGAQVAGNIFVWGGVGGAVGAGASAATGRFGPFVSEAAGLAIGSSTPFVQSAYEMLRLPVLPQTLNDMSSSSPPSSGIYIGQAILGRK